MNIKNSCQILVFLSVIFSFAATVQGSDVSRLRGQVDRYDFHFHKNEVIVHGWACLSGETKGFSQVLAYAEKVGKKQLSEEETNLTPSLRSVYERTPLRHIPFPLTQSPLVQVLSPIGYIEPRISSESAVNQICQNGSQANRFQLLIPDRFLRAHPGKKLVISVSHSSIQGSVELRNSQKFILPLNEPRNYPEFERTLEAQAAGDILSTGYIDGISYDAEKSVLTPYGWACTPGDENSVSLVAPYARAGFKDLDDDDLSDIDYDPYYDDTLLYNGKREFYYGFRYQSPRENSEPQVNDICNNGSQRNRFRLNISNGFARHFEVVFAMHSTAIGSQISATYGTRNAPPVLLKNSQRFIWPLR